MTCYDSENGKTFILGRKYLELERYFHKEIARVQAQWYGQQSGKGVKQDVYKRQDQVCERLSGRTAKSCRIQASKMEISKNISSSATVQNDVKYVLSLIHISILDCQIKMPVMSYLIKKI